MVEGTPPGTSRAWPVFAVAWFVAATGLSLYWCISETGPVGWVADVELRWVGEWHPQITTMVVVAALLLPLGIIRLVADAATGKPVRPFAGLAQIRGRLEEHKKKTTSA